MRKILKILLSLLFVSALVIGYIVNKRITQLKPNPTIKDSPTTIIGFNHIGLVVNDLDQMVKFYQEATGYVLISKKTVTVNKNLDLLYGQDSVQFEVAVLKAPNLFLEFKEFKRELKPTIKKMPPQGPGMTHTCFQTSEEDSGYHHFKNAGLDMLTGGEKPVALGNYGVTYAYGHDPEGNMIELEQMSKFVTWLKIGTEWARKNKIWMTQVAIMSHNVKRLTDFYENVLEINPYRVGAYSNNAGMDKIVNMDSVALYGAWFMLDGKEKKMELMQYSHPIVTTQSSGKRSVFDLGYTYSFEVLNIQEEYKRLKLKGVQFLSQPQKMDKYWKVLAHDVDGNIFSLRQAIDPEFSLNNFK